MLIEETSIEHIPLWIENYNDKEITVNTNSYNLPVLMSDQAIIALNEQLENISQLENIRLEQILALLSLSNNRPEILIFGTGKNRQYLDTKIEVELFKQGIAVEIMPTSSACRTVNILKAENRNVWAFLWPH